MADAFGAAVLRDGGASSLAPARRRALTLRFALAAAARLRRHLDPQAAPRGALIAVSAASAAASSPAAATAVPVLPPTMPTARLARSAASAACQTGAEPRRHYGDRGVLSAAGIVAFALSHRFEDGAAARLDQHHALAAEQHHDRAEPAAFDQRLRAAAISGSLATGMPVASASSRRLGISKSAPR